MIQFYILKILNKYYKKLHALKHISLKINKRSIHEILGLNGSGKSTLIRIISGLIKSWNGSIYLKNKLLDYNKPEFLNNFEFMM